MILMLLEQFRGCFLLWVEGDSNCNWECKRDSAKDRARKQLLMGEFLSLDLGPEGTRAFNHFLSDLLSLSSFPSNAF